ncbi:hypothetical protein [Carboxylicivirga linearis]|uniref:Uncharacterized protein n=1 Tax=Carboxylicivirga linearis TaxID=1628157 RepID=A0ABS5K263_9BACT|nr:hypothetical protein [Carboxylicivirga linearis]MBS2101213.1 hypothetical protein [Carboxylicivirga linearis]
MRLSLLVIFVISLFGCKTSQDLISDSDLLEILNIKVWKVPLPSDNTKQWGIKVIDVKPEKIKYSSFDIISKNESLISLKRQSKTEFEFVLKQNKGLGRGTISIQENYQAMTLFDEPKHYEKNLYAIGEIGIWDGYTITPTQLIVLRLIDK